MADDATISGQLTTSNEHRELVPQQTRALAVRSERAPVESYVPVFDTARFEHYGRIATVMFNSGMMPESLLKDGRDWVSPDVAKARAFMITELADRWNASPFALMPACSFVHGKMMLEGKVVHGAIEANAGVNLQYDFGRYYVNKEVTVVGEDAEGDQMGVRVSATLPGETTPRFIDGGVSIWKTTGTGSPWKPGAFKRQLRYRGAREWARSYKPSLLIGILTDDELDGMVERQTANSSRARGEKQDIRGKLPSANGGEGFSAEGIQAQTAGRVIEAEAVVVEPTELKVGGEPEREQDAHGATAQAETPETEATAQAEPAPAEAEPAPKDEAKPKGSRKAAAKAAPAKPAEPDMDEEADPIGDFIESLPGLEKWAEHIKPAWFVFKKTDGYKTATEERRREANVALVERVWELVDAGLDLKPHQDATFFTAWIMFMLEKGSRPAGAQEVTKELDLLRQTDAFKALSEGARQSIEGYAAHVIGEIGQGIV
jgi:hypothetical protein